MFAHLWILFSLVEVLQPWKLENLSLHVDVNKWASSSNLFPILIWVSVPATAFQNNSDEMSSSTSTQNEQAQRALLYIYLNFHRVHEFCRARSLAFPHIKPSHIIHPCTQRSCHASIWTDNIQHNECESIFKTIMTYSSTWCFIYALQWVLMMMMLSVSFNYRYTYCD